MTQRQMLLLVMIICVGGVGILLFFRSPEPVWQALIGNPDLGAVDFSGLKTTNRPNQFLLCPQEICKTSKPDQEPEVYRMTKEKLKARFIAALERDERQTVEDHDDGLRFIMRSPIFRFPDTVSVQFFTVDGGATLAIYARAQLGYYDFGANEKRVRRWLSKIAAHL